MDFPGNSETDKTQFIIAGLLLIGLAYWFGKWWLMAAALALVVAVYLGNTGADLCSGGYAGASSPRRWPIPLPGANPGASPASPSLPPGMSASHPPATGAPLPRG